MGSGTKIQFDALVVGAGPAGIAAATTAAECGLRVAMVDDNRRPGGQIWRGETIDHAPEATRWTQRLSAAGVASICGTRIFAQPQANSLLAEQDDNFLNLYYNKLILATGARERFLPFPGWTLLNVMGAGGLQALVKSGLPIEAKRVVIAGTGPLLLAVASYLRQRGAKVLAVCEQRPWADLTRFGLGLLRQPQKIQQALALRKELSGIPFLPNCWPLEATGKDVLEKVVLQRGGKTVIMNCDYLACGFHLIANTELAELLGCRIRDGFVKVDEFQQTSMPDVFCAGEPTGIGGLDLAIVEGQIAGYAAAGKTDAAKELFRQRRQMQSFAQLLDRTFALRPELRRLPSEETIVCRCEDVSYSQMSSHTSWRAAKLHTRCGMGPCQGRICGPATKFLFNWIPDSVRPPIFPTSLTSLSEGFSQFQPSQVTGEYE
jgi:NADPH-dependent 2,4-dienoyl-CoA reductase/sulfur reductase-like enzyme